MKLLQALRLDSSRRFCPSEEGSGYGVVIREDRTWSDPEPGHPLEPVSKARDTT